jgi:hypothetical protein
MATFVCSAIYDYVTALLHKRLGISEPRSPVLDISMAVQKRKPLNITAIITIVEPWKTFVIPGIRYRRTKSRV